MASTNKKSRGKTATANREGATAKKSLPPPSGLTRKPTASSAKASKKKAAESEAAAADGQTMPAPGEGEGKRKFSLRGAAPWAARHAARQAAEAAERMREPPDSPAPQRSLGEHARTLVLLEDSHALPEPVQLHVCPLPHEG